MQRMCAGCAGLTSDTGWKRGKQAGGQALFLNEPAGEQQQRLPAHAAAAASAPAALCIWALPRSPQSEPPAPRQPK